MTQERVSHRHQPGIGPRDFTVAVLAEAKLPGIPVEYLHRLGWRDDPTRGGVIVPWPFRVDRYRRDLAGSFRGPPRRRVKGVTLGDQTLAGSPFVVVVEGETDYAAARWCDLPVIAYAGASMVDPEGLAAKVGNRTVLVVREPDPGGEVFAAAVLAGVPTATVLDLGDDLAAVWSKIKDIAKVRRLVIPREWDSWSTGEEHLREFQLSAVDQPSGFFSGRRTVPFERCTKGAKARLGYSDRERDTWLHCRAWNCDVCGPRLVEAHWYRFAVHTDGATAGRTLVTGSLRAWEKRHQRRTGSRCPSMRVRMLDGTTAIWTTDLDAEGVVAMNLDQLALDLGQAVGKVSVTQEHFISFKQAWRTVMGFPDQSAQMVLNPTEFARERHRNAEAQMTDTLALYGPDIDPPEIGDQQVFPPSLRPISNEPPEHPT